MANTRDWINCPHPLIVAWINLLEVSGRDFLRKLKAHKRSVHP